MNKKIRTTFGIMSAIGWLALIACVVAVAIVAPDLCDNVAVPVMCYED